MAKQKIEKAIKPVMEISDEIFYKSEESIRFAAEEDENISLDKKVKVRFVKTLANPDGCFTEGRIVELPYLFVKQLLIDGVVVEVE